MNIIILGPQGSGKGTQAELLAKEFGFYHYDSGAYLRELAKIRPDIDQIINKEGAFIPDEVVSKIIIDHLDSLNQYDQILFDGHPRSTAQYKTLSDHLSIHGTKLNLVIFINISDKEAIRRLSSRRIDKKTGEIYNILTNPPGKEIEPQDLIQREDDSEEKIKRRLGWFHANVMPLMKFLKKENKVFEVDGEKPINIINKTISEKLKEYQNG